MYCKSCGSENTNSSNYCTHDGTYLKSSSPSYRLSDRTATFCSCCGISVISSNNYCHNCGKELQVYTREKKPISKLGTSIDSSIRLPSDAKIKLPKSPLESLKKALIPAITSVILLFVFSFFMVGKIEEFNSTDKLLGNALEQLDVPSVVGYYIEDMADPDRIVEIEKEMEYYLDQDVDVKLSSLPERFFNFTDFALLFNLQNPKLSMEMDMNVEGERQKANGSVLLKNGLLIWLIIPFIALFIAGVVSGRMNKDMEKSQLLYQAISIALIYSIVLAVLSLFTGFSYDASLKAGVNYFTLDITTRFSLIKTFVTTFILGFVFSGLGILFSTRFRKFTSHLSEWLPYGEAIHQAFSTVVRGWTVMFVVLAIVIYKKISELNENMSYFFRLSEDLLDNISLFVATTSAQLGSYLWNITHLAALKIVIEGTDIGESLLTYRLFSGLEAKDDAAMDGIYFLKEGLASTDIELYLKLAVLAPIIFFIWSGFRIGKNRNGQVLMNTLIYSLLYSVFMLLLAQVSDLGLVGDYKLTGDERDSGEMLWSLGFNPFVIFVQSFIFSFIFAYGGSFIHKLKLGRK